MSATALTSTAAGGTARPAARQPAIFLPHGGGPCFFMDWPAGANPWERMGEFLRGLLPTLASRPRAILVISGHWEEPEFTVNAGAAPSLLYDYYGFPAHTYQLSYPAPGAPELATRVQSLLAGSGIRCGRNTTRGFDHGVFVPLLLIDPGASLPVLQMSLKHGLDPAQHLAVGRALSSLRDDGVLIVGSGMSYHNLRGFSPEFGPASDAFDGWLGRAAADPDPARRDDALTRWRDAPQARIAHPREEHLLPLMVVAGAAGADRGRRIFEDRIPNVTVSAWQFGD